MKKFGINTLFLSLFFGTITFLSYSQGKNSNTESIEWKPAKTIYDSLGREIKVLDFQNSVYLSEFSYLPATIIRIDNKYVTSVNIIPEDTEPLTPEETKIIQNIPFTSNYQIQVKYEYGKPVSFLYIIPIINQNSIKKIKKFSYTYATGVDPNTNISRPLVRKSGKSNFRTNATQNSVLSEGDWYKFSINSSGVYKIDFNYLRNILKIDPSSIDPRMIKIFGNGGRMLPQPNSAERFDDLVENSIYISGEADGRFDPEDYIIFYGNGPHQWTYNSSEGISNHVFNIYSDVSCYFLTIGPGYGQRINIQNNSSGHSASYDTFNERYFHEQDLVNMLTSGREWLGETFDFILSRDFHYSVPGLVADSPMKFVSTTVARSRAETRFTIAINGNEVGVQAFTSPAFFDSHLYSFKGENKRTIFNLNTTLFSNNSNLRVNYTFNKMGIASAIGYLNFFEIHTLRQLKLYGPQTSFRVYNSTGHSLSEYIISEADAESIIWDVTDIISPSIQQYNLAGNEIRFTAASNTLKEYVLFNPHLLAGPTFISKIQNQNLHGIQATDLPDLVIVTHPDLLPAANKLKQFRETFDNLETTVVTVDQIYNEFSSGIQDISAIRDFIKMLYDRRTTTDSVRFVLLFGDCSYDYKNRIAGNTNFVPIYQSRQFLHPIYTYSSDDYFGFLDNHEGLWAENSGGNHLMDVGIGRLPVKSLSEADAVVNKLIHYNQSLSCLGNWKNKLTFVADDGDGNLHMHTANIMADKVEDENPTYNINKLFLDAYPSITTPSGKQVPDVNKGIDQAIHKGTFFINFTGHGNEYIWTGERVLEKTHILKWTNIDRMPFMVCATCEFGRYDDPGVISGAETGITHGNGGVVGLLTATRPVFSNSNEMINTVFYKHVFKPVSGEFPRLGDVMKITKNNSLIDVNNRNYALLGDPAMKLAYPPLQITITNINGNDLSSVGTDTLKALGKVKIEGEVRMNNVLLDTYNGKIYPTVYDKKTTIRTLTGAGMNFSIRNNIIYDGIASVKSGKFSFEFVVPKDISYQFDKGKISIYSENQTIIDAAGYNYDIIVGGTAANVVADNTPPQVKVFLNDESFVSGGITGSNPLLLVKLFDENGINTVGTGIGHEITLILNNGQPVVLNDYYVSNLDDYKNGTIRYPLKDLPPGNYSIKIKAWDTHNNSGEGYVEFVVTKDEKTALQNIFNFPNPFANNTIFHFDHNRPGEDLDVMIQIFTVSGKLIKTINNRYHSSPSHIGDIVWDGRDDFNDKLAKGVYVYKVSVRSLRDNSNNFKYQKLVILN
ncbi:MAG: type IX secretion system sortase PorU [Cytophagaceae bacterium]